MHSSALEKAVLEIHWDSSTDLVKNGFGNFMNEANDGVIRIRTYP